MVRRRISAVSNHEAPGLETLASLAIKRCALYAELLRTRIEPTLW
jgi:hypothetical protein